MAPTLIVLGLLALGVAIVAWATRRRSGQPKVVRHEQDVVWNDAMSGAQASASEAPRLTPPSVLPSNDPFAAAPPLSTTEPRP